MKNETPTVVETRRPLFNKVFKIPKEMKVGQIPKIQIWVFYD
jgi:hypothetical protein